MVYFRGENPRTSPDQGANRGISPMQLNNASPSVSQDEAEASQRGLSSDEASRRLAETGPNEPAFPRRGGVAVQLVLLLANPLVIILLLASFVSALVGEGISAAIIVIVVLLGAVINFVQTYHSQRALERLRQQVALTATVMRDGKWQELDRRDLVPGDRIRLSAGDLVPVDAQLLQARDLHVQEGALTGESMPVEKEPDGVPGATASATDRTNAVFAGTSIVSERRLRSSRPPEVPRFLATLPRGSRHGHPKPSSTAEPGDSAS